MSTEEKKIVESLAEAVKKLPDNKKEYLMGYAEGVNAMSERKEAGKNDGPRGEIHG